MAITTEYRCDKCAAIVKSSELFILTVMVKPSIGPTYGTGKTSRATVCYCTTCMTTLGIDDPNPSFSYVEHKPTIEELIQEIAINAVQD